MWGCWCVGASFGWRKKFEHLPSRTLLFPKGIAHPRSIFVGWLPLGQRRREGKMRLTTTIIKQREFFAFKTCYTLWNNRIFAARYKVQVQESDKSSIFDLNLILFFNLNFYTHVTELVDVLGWGPSVRLWTCWFDSSRGYFKAQFIVNQWIAFFYLGVPQIGGESTQNKKNKNQPSFRTWCGICRTQESDFKQKLLNIVPSHHIPIVIVDASSAEWRFAFWSRTWEGIGDTDWVEFIFNLYITEFVRHVWRI